ncbi:MAG: Brp/Blh family beta-carotene 15,15'-dioxygenase [Paracoccaceae bacterium]
MSGGEARLARHRLAFLCLAPPIVAGLALAQPGPVWQLALLAPLVALVGVPHGALDQHVAGFLWPLRGWRGHLAFSAVYLGLAALVLGFWQVAPAAALAAFVIYSGVHFAGDWHDELSRPCRLLFGTAIVTLPAGRVAPEIEWVFAALSPEGAAGVVAVQRAVGLAVLAALVPVLAWLSRTRPLVAAEMAIVAAAALVLEPLLYFVVYFCALHSIRHFLATTDTLGMAPGRALAAAVPLTLSTLAMAGVGFVLVREGGMALDQGVLHVVFVALAALTVPHMVLVERLHHHGRVGAGRG